jgi:adenylate cyclase 1
VDKIKTIGSTYMAAVGLIPEFKIADEKEDGGLSAMTYLAQVITESSKYYSQRLFI